MCCQSNTKYRVSRVSIRWQLTCERDELWGIPKMPDPMSADPNRLGRYPPSPVSATASQQPRGFVYDCQYGHWQFIVLIWLPIDAVSLEFVCA